MKEREQSEDSKQAQLVVKRTSSQQQLAQLQGINCILFCFVVSHLLISLFLLKIYYVPGLVLDIVEDDENRNRS